MRLSDGNPKPLKWVGPTKHALKKFPMPVQKEIGYALFLAQIGMKALKAKPLGGFGGAGVLEIIEDFRGDTYRAIYTVKFGELVFVLHVFQKKSKSGIATPKPEIDLIKDRLKVAAELYHVYRSYET
ncbi:MAG TPA: type II toxin-antitoxin system RelE/ParE family toxin [Tepidisphaeraceae bacterium]|jgi:phage-related protein